MVTMPTPVNTIFGKFSTQPVAGAAVKIQTRLLEDAASGALGIRNTYRGTMRVFNLAQLYGYKYDFHLSFKLDQGSQWADAGHFCARDDVQGKNACAYWFYDLVYVAGSKKLAWSFKGSAPDNALYSSFMESIAININGAAASPIAQKMLARSASAPLDKLLRKFESLISQGRAEVVVEKQVVNLRFKS